MQLDLRENVLTRVAIVALPLLLAGIACSSTASFDSFPSASGGVSTGPNGSTGGSFGPCPVDPYSTDAHCTAPLLCEYGTSSSAACNTVAICNDQGFFDITPASTTSCDSRCPTFEAPGALATSQGTACLHGSRGSLVCGSPYDRSTCGCTDGSTSDGGVPPPTSEAGATDASATNDAGADPDASGSDTDGGEGGATVPGVPDVPDVSGVWVCVTPTTGCPATRPLLGSSCVRELTCDYGACLFPGGMKVACATSPDGAHWIDQTPQQCGL